MEPLNLMTQAYCIRRFKKFNVIDYFRCSMLRIDKAEICMKLFQTKKVERQIGNCFTFMTMLLLFMNSYLLYYFNTAPVIDNVVENRTKTRYIRHRVYKNDGSSRNNNVTDGICEF